MTRAIAGFVATPRDVFADAEATAMSRALRSTRMLEIAAPTSILETELQLLGEAVAALDGEDPQPQHEGDADDPMDLPEVPNAIFRHARFDLSLGLHSETLRVLERVARKRFDRDPAAGLYGGEPMVRFEEIDRREASASAGERVILSPLRHWRRGPDLDTFISLASDLAHRLADTPTSVREKVMRELDEDAPPILRGDDYVASAEAHLRAIATDAASAERQGLVLLSENSRSLSYG